MESPATSFSEQEALLPRIRSPQDLQPLTDEQLEQLAQEMRDELVRVLSIRPAHFASNLGVVELCLALHLTYDFSRDRLIWDTGHQIYPHKLVTGRHARFDTIRTRGGLMGYPNPHESDYDLFMTGHAGCSVSTVLGLKSGDDLLGHGDRRAVAVVGDGALVSGIVFEALNNAGYLGKKLLVDGQFAALSLLALAYLIGLVINGSTFGMAILGLRVTMDDGSKAGLYAIGMRTVLLFLVIPAVVWDQDGRGLHDRIAHTMIVTTR